MAEFNLVHYTSLGLAACQQLCASTILLLNSYKVLRAKIALFLLLTSDNAAERSLAQFKQSRLLSVSKPFNDDHREVEKWAKDIQIRQAKLNARKSLLRKPESGWKPRNKGRKWRNNKRSPRPNKGSHQGNHTQTGKNNKFNKQCSL